MANILIVEDNDDSFEISSQVLSDEHNVLRAITVSQAKKMYNEKIDLLILDVGLPDGDGFEFCHWIRSHYKSDLPIIFVSAKTTTESCITGFTSGGDDYIYKPYHPSEFLARVNAKLKSQSRKLGRALSLASNGIKIDLSSQKAFLVDGEKTTELSLTPIEFKILQIFLKDPETAVSRDEILDRVWGRNIYVYPRSVDTHISKLRKKLGSKGDSITSVHGRGYRMVQKDGQSQSDSLQRPLDAKYLPR